MLLQRLKKTIRNNNLLLMQDRVIVAISGGSDSVALLHLLNDLSLTLDLIAVYVDHGLRPTETPSEIAFIASLCKQLHIQFHTVHVATKTKQKESKCSLEEAARILRYQALEKMRVQYDAMAIAVAHTADDQVEETLIRLIRGTGRKGLSGMEMHNGKIIRPLLKENKNTLLDYLHTKGIPFCTDSTNQERVFLRNRVRLDLLPFLEKNFNHSIRQQILQTIDILSEEENLLETLSQKEFEKIVQFHSVNSSSSEPTAKKTIIDTTSFRASHPALQRRILEKICWKMNSKPEFRQIQQLCHLILNGGTGAEAHLKEGLRCKKDGDKVIFSYPLGKKRYRGSAKKRQAKIYQEIPGTGSYTNEDLEMTLTIDMQQNSAGASNNIEKQSLFLDATDITFPLLMRTPKPGERFSPLGMSGTKKVARFFSDAKVPVANRHNFPVLISSGKIIAIAGLRIDNHYRIQPECRQVLVIKWSKKRSS